MVGNLVSIPNERRCNVRILFECCGAIEGGRHSAVGFERAKHTPDPRACAVFECGFKTEVALSGMRGMSLPMGNDIIVGISARNTPFRSIFDINDEGDRDP
jgi:hypothetical protein